MAWVIRWFPNLVGEPDYKTMCKGRQKKNILTKIVTQFIDGQNTWRCTPELEHNQKASLSLERRVKLDMTYDFIEYL